MSKKTLIFDLDGTMYRGTKLIPEALDAVKYCQEHEVDFLFLTNNAMRTPEENVKHMETMGYTGLKPEQFYNSAMASASYVKKHYPGNKAFYIGRESVKKALEAEGFEITDTSPDFVFVGLDEEADFNQYSHALMHLLNGAKLIGTNKDRILAKPEGFELGNGSIIAMFEYATGQKSPDIAKPARPILDLCLEHYHLKPEDVILVGDNLETDIRLGFDNHVETVFVQTGVHHEDDIERLHIYPDHVIKTLDELDIESLAGSSKI